MKIRLFVPKTGDLAYTEIPKCACSTVKQYLNAVACGAFHDGDIHHTHPGLLRWRYDRLRILSRLLRRRHHHFTFVRNPHARLVSAFYDKVINPQADGRMYGKAPLRAAIDAYGITADVDPILAFRRFVVLARDSVLFADPVEADIHWMPMAWHAASAMRLGFAYDEVFHVESFATDLRGLMERLAPGRAAEWAEVRVFNESARDGVRRTAPVAAHYDTTSRLLVQEAFRDDFAAFGYSTDPDVAAARPVAVAEVNARLVEVRRRAPWRVSGRRRGPIHRLIPADEGSVLAADDGFVDLRMAQR